MKQVFWAALTSALLFVGEVGALHGECGVDALYWAPMHGTTTFVGKAQNPGTPSLRVEHIPFASHYHWGVRPYVRGGFGCFEGHFQYVWYQAHDTAVRRSPSLNLVRPGSIGLGSLVNGTQLFGYQNADLRLGSWLGQMCAIKVQFFVNGGWVYLKRRLFWKVGAPEAVASSLSSEDTFSGGRIGAGLVLCRPLWRCMEVDAVINPMIGIGRRADKRLDRAPSTGLILRTRLREISSCIPAISARLGVKANYLVGCINLAVRLGYEVDYYWRALAQQQLENNSPTRVVDCDSVGFCGPYLGLEVGF